ncbi:MAG: phosphate ABC transporter ATP-binding protein [Ignavibacteria bacterium GWA2_55_11]|nr:MAG: phosphate ABC transporter ATP-binding protein [Ignavibacteria bacterium GWA2_55_11]OGU47641.1 MAG: phosphate ABC transporter ATP-binding protein [Ignavibacteria bacterium GWC2_56_12]OGU62703.1 MAG: phosphate ABC transporter ATP-binding protein [Ignavibacteria bacterium RIFCSPHIGHO2_02_FULL_56_12]OGU70518.1 MAG: phosphate ABC transporter ATP-binding protein [Ignavibacteria bacterium RIFCSPLOWO2_02_FULL_55_14]OGU72384.1 MAG: phosphate ABC transporter ATP-binding protein [Ignavibacteria ba
MDAKFDIQNLSVYFRGIHALKSISMAVPSRRILGVIGPAGSGKTTLLRALNRTNELEETTRIEGNVRMDGHDIYDPSFDVVALRRKVGIVFALPVPLPMSIYDNVTYGPTLAGSPNKQRLDMLVEKSLRDAFLWDEVKDRLTMSGLRLSGGQQQRLCLARVLAMEPDVILLDEPCSGLDPISTARIEEALTLLKKDYTIILVTNNTKQAARVADDTAFFLMGEMVELGTTDQIFTSPVQQKTNDYITGRFG